MVPGAPDDVRATGSSATSLTLQARLSTVGTAPFTSAHFAVSDPDGILFTISNVTKELSPGEVVTVDVVGLQPSTTYSVLVYAANVAGRGQDSIPVTFTTCMYCVTHDVINLLCACMEKLVACVCLSC